MLGDVIIAEPKAMIGFAGPRVIEQTVRQTLPEGFQTSEFLLEKGAIDMIVHRGELRGRICTLVRLFGAADLSDVPIDKPQDLQGAEEQSGDTSSPDIPGEGGGVDAVDAGVDISQGSSEIKNPSVEDAVIIAETAQEAGSEADKASDKSSEQPSPSNA